MSAASGVRICCVCNQPILGTATETTHDSMSGARPSTWSHADERACRTAREDAR